MATRKAFVVFGDSLAAGKGYLSLVPSATFQRWTGSTWPSGSTAARDVSVDDIIMFTPKLPYGVSASATAAQASYIFDYDNEAVSNFTVGETLTFNTPATAVLLGLKDSGTTGTMVIGPLLSGTVPVDNDTIAGGTSLATADVNGTPSAACLSVATNLFASTDVSRWVYVSSGTGQGQLRRIDTYVDAKNVGINTAWTTSPTSSNTIEFYTDSMSVTGSSSTTLTWDINTAVTALTSAVVGKWVVCLSGANVGAARKIANVSAHQITFDEAWTYAPASGDGLRILSGSGSVDDLADLTSTNSALRPLRFYQDEAKTYSTGFDYPNFYLSPLIAPVNHASNDSINCVPELLWRLKHHVDGPIYGLQLGQGGATCGASPVGTLSHLLGSLAPISWGWEITNNDWRPNATYGLYGVLTSMISAMATLANAAGDTLDIQGFFPHLGTNDASDTTRTEMFLKNMTFLRDSLREWTSANSYSSLAPQNIPWVMSGIGPAAGRPAANVTSCNAAMLQMEQDDPFTGYVDTTDTSVFSYDIDGVHLDQDGSVQDGVALYQKWVEVISRITDPNVLDMDRPTLGNLRSRVKRRYERNTSGNAATADQINVFINDSLREFYNTIGDNPWFLRRKETITVSATYPTTTTLPRTIRRIVRVEDAAYPGRMIPYQCMGFTDSGRIEMSLHGAPTSQVTVWHLIVPRELVGDGDRCMVPLDYVELVVILTCKRLAEAAGNVNLASYYDAELVRLWKYVKRNVLAHGRMSNDQLSPGDSYDAIRGGTSTDSLWGL